MFGTGYKSERLSTNLKLCQGRLKLLQKKKTELATKSRKEIANYIADGKVDRARIRVEHIIREDYLVEAMDIIESYCDLLDARRGLIDSTEVVDEGLSIPIATLFWVESRMVGDVPELKVVCDQLARKYGKEFALQNKNNALNLVNPKIVIKLGVTAPPDYLVESYLEEIAKSYNVPFESPHSKPEEVDTRKPPVGGGSGGPGGGIPENPNLIDLGFAAAPPVPHAPPVASPTRQNALTPPPVYHPVQPGPSQPVPPANYNIPAQPGPSQQPYPGSLPSYNPDSVPAAGDKPGPPPQPGFLDIPDLPDVPRSRGNSPAPPDDIDFDDLTKRFEALKNRK